LSPLEHQVRLARWREVEENQERSKVLGHSIADQIGTKGRVSMCGFPHTFAGRQDYQAPP
jgi:hypothetical protein